jgi:hypothetical protein
MGFSEQQDNIWDWVNGILNPLVDGEPPANPVPIIWEAEKGTRPTKSYIQLNIPSDTSLGTVEKTLVEVDPNDPEDMGEQTLIGHADFTLSVQGFGKNAINYLKKLREESEKQVFLELLNAKGFVLRNVLPILPVPEIIDETPEKRWAMDIILGYVWSTVDTPGYIEHVVYSGEVNPPK